MNENNPTVAAPPKLTTGPAKLRPSRSSKLRLLLALLVIVLVAGFVFLNWEAFVAPTALTLGFARVEAPLGIMLLALLVVIALPLMAYAGYLRRAALLQAGRLVQDLQALRKLADNAEGSRYTALRQRWDEGMREAAERDEALRADVLARLARIETSLATVAARRDPDLSGNVSVEPTLPSSEREE
jgi:uncharacterized integral membrane protein